MVNGIDITCYRLAIQYDKLLIPKILVRMVKFWMVNVKYIQNVNFMPRTFLYSTQAIIYPLAFRHLLRIFTVSSLDIRM